MVSIKLKVPQAINNRDSLSKNIYSNLFDFIIKNINQTLKTEISKYSIGILDIFGFEVFPVNSFVSSLKDLRMTHLCSS